MMEVSARAGCSLAMNRLQLPRPPLRRMCIAASSKRERDAATEQLRNAKRMQWRQPPTESLAIERSGSRSGSSLDSRDDTQIGQEQLSTSAAAPAWGTAWWVALPARYKIVTAAAMSFVICNMDKVNMSIAIIPMAQDYGWSPSVSGLVQSSFFWGYMLCQLPGGYLASRYGGRKVLPAGVGMWSLATAAVPLLAGTVGGLCFSRAAVGLGEAVAPSAATDMVSRTVPTSERSRAVSFVFSGLHVGSIAGLLAAPYLISNFGWEVVFVTFGAAGVVWTLWFEQVLAAMAITDPDVVAQLVENRLAVPAAAPAASTAGDMSLTSSSASSLDDGTTSTSQPAVVTQAVPYRAFLRSRPVQALMYTHFCNNWFHYTMLAWLPTYFTDTLSVDLMHAARTALLPPMAGIVASAIAGPAADGLLGAGWSVPTVRKLAQSLAFLLPTACLWGASLPLEDSNITVALITAALGVSSFSLAGLYCTHQDLSPKYASAMLGLTNTAGAVPGIVGVAVTGYLYDETGSWPLALFMPTTFFLLTGAAVYAFLGRNEPQEFDAPELNVPFGFEQRLSGVTRAAGGAWEAVRSAAAQLLKR